MKIHQLAKAFAFWLIPLLGIAQVTVKGTVVNSTTNAPLGEVFVYVPETNSGTITDTSGAYSLQGLKKSRFIIQFTHIGYKSNFMSIDIVDTMIELHVALEPSLAELKEVKVIGTQTNSPGETSFNVAAISLREMEENGALSISDGVAKLPGVSQLATGAGISKPVIRGLYGNRVQVNVMGLRFDNQQWQDEHGLGLSGIGVSRVQIIKGPATLMYGSDALGGVLKEIEEAPAPLNSTEQDVNLKVYSNTYGLAADYGYKKSTGKSWWRFNIGGESHGDYSSSGDKRVLNSRFATYNVKASRGINRRNFVHKTNAYISFSQFGFVFDSLQRKELDGRLSRSFDGPHHRVLFGLFSTENTIYRGKTKYKINGGLITNIRQEQEGGNRISLNMLLNTVSLLAQATTQVLPHGEFTNGVSLMFQSNTNYGARTIVPDAITLEGSAFTYYKQRLDKWIVEAGLRYDRRQIKTYETSTINSLGKEIQPFNRGLNALNGSIGVAYNPLEAINLKANASSGYRSGNLAELSSNGLHEGTLRWEIGNPDLKAEQNLNLEAGINYEFKGSIEANVTGFCNRLFNYIYLAPTGEEYVGFLIYDFLQTDATLRGVEATLDVHPKGIKWLDIMGNYTFLEAQKDDRTYLPFIPANKLNAELRLSKNFKRQKLQSGFVKLGGTYMFSQNKPDVFETPTNSYYLIDAALGGSLRINKKALRITLVGTNLMDTQYYDHLSRYKYYGLYNMGRNISLVVNLTF